MPERVSREWVEAQVELAQVSYHRFEGTTVTVCCITLPSGFSLVGYSACCDPDDFSKAIGERYAHEDAMNKLWTLEAYHRIVTSG